MHTCKRGVQLAASGGHKRVAALADWMLDAALRLAFSHDTKGARHERCVGERASDEALFDGRGIRNAIDMVKGEDWSRSAIGDKLDCASMDHMQWRGEQQRIAAIRACS